MCNNIPFVQFFNVSIFRREKKDHTFTHLHTVAKAAATEDDRTHNNTNQRSASTNIQADWFSTSLCVRFHLYMDTSMDSIRLLNQFQLYYSSQIIDWFLMAFWNEKYSKPSFRTMSQAHTRTHTFANDRDLGGAVLYHYSAWFSFTLVCVSFAFASV